MRPVGVVTIGVLVLTLPAPLRSQECSLESSAPVEEAAEAISNAQAAEDSALRARLYHHAVQAVDRALSENPDDPAALWLAGQARIGLGDYGLADTLLGRFVEIAPACLPLAEQTRRAAWVDLYNEGIRLYEAGREHVALQLFESASLLYPDSRSFGIAGRIYSERGDTVTALDRFRIATEVARDPDQLRAAINTLAELLGALGRNEELLEQYRVHVQRRPDQIGLACDFAVALANAGKIDSAMAILSGFLARDDLGPQDWNEVGVALHRVAAYPEAVTALRRARELEPFNKDAMTGLLDALLGAGEFALARGLADTLVSWHRYDALNYSALAKALGRIGESAAALQVLERERALPFEFRFVRLRDKGAGRYVLEGQVAGRPGGAGRQYSIPFEFLGHTGEVLERRTLELNVPREGGIAGFVLEVHTQGEVPLVGFRYGEAEPRP